jgi:hypothetical protein
MLQMTIHRVNCWEVLLLNRIALGPQQGCKVFTLQTLPDLESDNPFSSSVGEVAGFSLHAGVATKANERATKSRRPQASWNACAVT